jgi:ribA/ribD-fused uncharacterized protein
MPDAIRRFQYDDGSHSPLSNFYVAPFFLDGQEWPTVEHYFQATKTDDLAAYNRVRVAPSPGQAKRLGRLCVLRRDWEQIKLRVMRTALEAKFAPESSLGEWLTATGDVLLVEGNDWHDTFWGVCTCPQHHDTGDNWLGHLLLARRAELRAGA